MRFALVVLVTALRHSALAQEAPQPKQAGPHLDVSGTLGVITPLGYGGIELEAHFARWLSVSAGAGFAKGGPQLAAMARGGVPIDRSHTIYGGLGFSGGRYQWDEMDLSLFNKILPPFYVKTWNRAYWANA